MPEEWEKLFSLEEAETKMRKVRENNLLLSDYQVEVLRRNQIDYEKCSSMKELLFQIEEQLNDSDDSEDLETVSRDIAELLYYKDTNQ